MDITIHHADLVFNNNREEFAVSYDVRDDKGKISSYSYFFPSDIFETRAAEYGVPISDFQTLLEMVFFEPFLTPETDDKLKTVHTAESIEEARDFHLSRISTIKGRGSITGVSGSSLNRRVVPDHVEVIDTSDTLDPISFLETAANLDEEYISFKREYVASLRERANRGDFESLGIPKLADRHRFAAARSSGAESDSSEESGVVRRNRPSVEEMRKRLLPDRSPSKPADVLPEFMSEEDRNLLQSRGL